MKYELGDGTSLANLWIFFSSSAEGCDKSVKSGMILGLLSLELPKSLAQIFKIDSEDIR